MGPMRRKAIENTALLRNSENRTTPTRARRKIKTLDASPPARPTNAGAKKKASTAKEVAAAPTRIVSRLWNAAKPRANRAGRTAADSFEVLSRYSENR